MPRVHPGTSTRLWCISQVHFPFPATVRVKVAGKRRDPRARYGAAAWGVTSMKRIIVSAGLCSAILSALCVPACAEETAAAGSVPWLAHWAITLLGMGLAARLAWQAFGHEVVVGN